jgi:hypothetical protein
MKRRIVATTNSYPNCSAEITVKRNSVKKYADNVYLKNNQEFELLLRNNAQATVVATISMNGKRISTSGIVLKPGQKVYLERYLDENKKFLFETYNVDNTNEALQAIQNNGNIEVKFYKEKEVPQTRLDYYYQPAYVQNTISGQAGMIGIRSSRPSYSTGTNFFSQNASTVNYSKGTASITTNSASLDSVETGMVGKGSSSNQEFKDYTGDFETYPFKTVSIKILPFSAKPTEVSDLVVYCTNCGTKNKKGNYKYCPKCGTKFE